MNCDEMLWQDREKKEDEAMKKHRTSKKKEATEIWTRQKRKQENDGTFLPPYGGLTSSRGVGDRRICRFVAGGCRPGCRWWVSWQKGEKLSRQQKITDTFACYLLSVLVHVEIVYSYTDSSINAKTNNDCPTAVRAMKCATCCTFA